MILPCFSRTYKHAHLPGGDPAGKHIYNRGSANGKRVQCNMGAKNHGVIMPDANKEYTINQLVGAAFGAAGQRCMALTTAVMVGDSQARCEMRDTIRSLLSSNLLQLLILGTYSVTYVLQ